MEIYKISTAESLLFKYSRVSSTVSEHQMALDSKNFLTSLIFVIFYKLKVDVAQSRYNTAFINPW